LPFKLKDKVFVVVFILHERRRSKPWGCSLRMNGCMRKNKWKSKVGLGNLRERKEMIYLFLHETSKRMWSPVMLCNLLAAQK